MSTVEKTTDLIHECRDALIRFWGDALGIEPTADGVVLALPLMRPDGLQIVVQLRPVTATAALLSDRGETFGHLQACGLNLEAAATRQLLEERLRIFEVNRDGFELQKSIRLPVDGMDIQLFGEALVSLAHLIYRYEPEPAEENVVDRTVQRVFRERGVQPRRHAFLEGRLEKRIQVDYYVEVRHGLALQVVNRRHQLLPYMEQWGWRWLDLRERHPQLVRAMVYDPERQPWDETALEIGRNVCDLFCPYFETERIDATVMALKP